MNPIQTLLQAVEIAERQGEQELAEEFKVLGGYAAATWNDIIQHPIYLKAKEVVEKNGK